MNLENFQHLYDTAKTSPQFMEWVKTKKETTQEYRDCMLKYETIEEWDPQVLNKCFYDKESGSAKLVRGKFSKKQCQTIYNNWNKVKEIIRTHLLKEKNITGKDYLAVKTFFEKELKLNGQPAAINRVILNFLPYQVASVCDHNKLIRLSELLKKELDNYNREKGNNWFTDADNFVYFCKKNLKFDDEYDLPTFAWWLIEYYNIK